jgi:AraC-like DNA-binding protein
MKKMIFPVITDFDTTLPYYLIGVGCCYEQEHIIRPNGFPNYQWIQCRSGSGKLIMNQTSYTVSENQGMLLFPDVPHEYYATTDSWQVDWVIIHGRNIEDFFQNTAPMKNSGVYYVAQPHTIADKIAQAYELEQISGPAVSIEGSRLAYDILMDILKFASDKSDSSYSSRYNRMKPIFDFIEENYAGMITLSDLAEVAGITPQHLCHVFKQITTHSVIEYVNMIRIKKSQEMMLQNRELQIKEVAGMVGFHDISYFCATFRKQVNMSPTEFKNLLL